MITRCPYSASKSYSVLVTLIVSLLLLAGCNLPSSIPPTFIPLPSSTPLPPLDTPTAAPSTPTLQPAATNTSVPRNIVFATGTTAAVAQGTVQPGQAVSYTLGAGQNQPMILILDSPNNDVTLGVFELNGNKLLDPANKWTRWQWLLPKTETYTIQVIGGATTETYTLTAKVAQLVYFASGVSTITLNGTTVNGYVFTYALVCKASQTMAATLNVPSTTAYLDVFGLASGPLLSSSAKANNWTGSLPSTQTYVVEVIPNNGQVVNYGLIIICH